LYRYTMECVYLDPAKPYPYLAAWPATQCWVGEHGRMALAMCGVATLAYWAALAVVRRELREPAAMSCVSFLKPMYEQIESPPAC
jgi:hypothetical protein